MKHGDIEDDDDVDKRCKFFKNNKMQIGCCFDETRGQTCWKVINRPSMEFGAHLPGKSAFFSLYIENEIFSNYLPTMPTTMMMTTLI